MPKKITKEVYSFSELSPEAKERARDWWRETAFDHDWWDFIFSDAVEVGKILGIEFDSVNQGKRRDGRSIYEPAIYFEGFHQQGSGACFTGTWGEARDAARRIRDHAAWDTELHDIADQLTGLQLVYDFTLGATITKRGGCGSHEHCVSIDVGRSNDSGDFDCDVPHEVEKAIADLLRRFMKWIYRQLEAEYEYQNSDDCVDENIKANDYAFDVNGERCPEGDGVMREAA